MQRGTVVAAMSGGVDSAVTAALLKQQGYDVIGVTLQVWQEHAEDGKYGSCCSLGAVEDARRAAGRIGIPHYVLNFREHFADTVIRRFVDDYARGRTPNPCVECNRSVKFDELLAQARSLGADWLATGHYARVRFNEASGQHELLRARAADKDQSYALYTLTQAQLASTMMPLGEMRSKAETRDLARALGLAVADKPDSQEICFVPKEGYTAYLRERAPEALRPGPIVDAGGALLGQHEGIAGYTIGQRKRLPPSSGGALVVLALEPATNTVVVGREPDLLAHGLEASDAAWSAIAEPPAGHGVRAQVAVRYRGGAVPCTVSAGDSAGTLRARFDAPIRAVTPGQAAVFYGGEGEDAGQVVLCGGTIERALTADDAA